MLLEVKLTEDTFRVPVPSTFSAVILSLVPLFKSASIAMFDTVLFGNTNDFRETLPNLLFATSMPAPIDTMFAEFKLFSFSTLKLPFSNLKTILLSFSSCVLLAI